MRLYVASSWRNAPYPEVVAAMIADGHDVYDFRNPPGGTGFSWQQVDATNAKTIEAYYCAIDTETAERGFASDEHYLNGCDALLLVLPCGRSAHLEAGFAIGQGKKVVILLHEDAFEPELMYLLAGRANIVHTLEEARSILRLADDELDIEVRPRSLVGEGFVG